MKGNTKLLIVAALAAVLALAALPAIAGGVRGGVGRETKIAAVGRSLSVGRNFTVTPPQKCVPAAPSDRAMPSVNATDAKPRAPWSKVYAPVQAGAAAGPAILVYVDDPYHRPTYVDLALQ